MSTNLADLFEPAPTNIKGLVVILKDFSKSIQDSMEFTFNQRFDNMERKFEELLQQRNEKVTALETEVASLKNKVEKLEERIESNDAYERRDTVIISGSQVPAPAAGENCTQIVMKLVQDNLQVSLQPDEISVCHRLASRSTSDPPSKRSVIVKFCRRTTKVDLLASARSKKAQNFYVNECLTPSAQAISYALRQAKRKCPNVVTGSTTYDGKNFVWVKPPNPRAKPLRYAIPTIQRLTDFCTRTLEKPLSEFISESRH